MTIFKSLDELVVGDKFEFKHKSEYGICRVLKTIYEKIIIVNILSGHCWSVEHTIIHEVEPYRKKYRRVGRMWISDYKDCNVRLLVGDELMVELL